MNLNKMNNSIIKMGFVLGFIAIYLSACSEEAQKKLAGFPVALSQRNEIVFIMDKPMWEGAVGDSCRAYFGGDFPVIPQPEPIFDLKFFTPRMLSERTVRKEFRSYIFVANLNDESSPTTRMVIKDIGEEQTEKAKSNEKVNMMVGHDKWAKGQQLIYLFGGSDDDLMKAIAQKFPTITRRVHKFDRGKLSESVYYQGVDEQIMKTIKDTMGVNIKVPGEYFIALNKGNTIWLRSNTQKVAFNIMLHKYKYTDAAQFTKESIKAVRDEIGKFVSTEAPNTYMQINDVDLPMLLDVVGTEKVYKVKVRGIWEIENDFMGGPFIGYLIHNPETNELLYIDGFIHAPSTTKRDYIQELDLILQSVSF